MADESSEPRYFGPCLVAPLVLRAQQPEPAAWVPPRDWNPKTAGWDPRITYQGLSDEAKESLTEEFLLFEIPGNEDDDPEDPLVQKSKGHVLLAKLPTLFRSMGRTNKARNAMCIEQCRLKSVPHPASGATCLHVAEFLKVMDDELRQDAVELAQSDADGLTQRLRDAERAWEATNTPLVAQAAAEAAARDHWTNTVAARARWYGRVDARSPREIGHAAKMAAARRAAARNDPRAMQQVLEADRFAVGEHNAAAAAAARFGAAAAEAALAAGAPPSIAEAAGAAVAGKVGLDPVLLRNVASGGDGEEVSSLHQLALSRHPRERGRVPGAAATTATAAAAAAPSAAAPPGDAAAALSADPRADFVPAVAANYHQLPPWQRPRPLPASRAAAVVVRSDRASAYAPYLPPPEFWEDRQSAGLQAKAKAAAHEAKMASRAAAAAAAAAAVANGNNSGDAQQPSRARAGSEHEEGVADDDDDEEVKGGETSDETKVAAAAVAGPVRLEVGPAAAKGRWPIMTKAEERLRAAKAAALAARKEAAKVANNSKANDEKEESKKQSSPNNNSNKNNGKGHSEEQGAADKDPQDANNTGINTNDDDDDDDLDDVDRAKQLALAQAQEAAAARQAEEEEARAEAERKKWKTLSPEERLDITETKALAEAQKRAAVQLNEMRQAQDERAWEMMRQRSKVAALNKAVLSGRLQHNLMRLNLRVPGWSDPQALKKEAQKAELKDQRKKEKEEKRKKKELERGDERGSNDDFNLSDDDENDDDDEDDDDESNETSSTYTARSLSSMTTNTIAQKAARREEKAQAAALAAAEEEAQRLREREAALEWLKHTDLHTANVADALMEAEVDRMLEAAVSEAAAERYEARLARAPPKHNPNPNNPPAWTSKLHLRELGPVNCMALGPGLPLSSPNVDDDVDDESDECNGDGSGKIASDGEEGHKMSKDSELKARNSDNGSRNGRRRRCRDQNAAWASADLLAVGRDDEGVSVWNLAGSIEEEIGGSVGGLGGGGRQDSGKDISLRSSSKSNIKRSGGGVRLASWVSHYGPARTPVPFVSWLPGLPVDYTSPAANFTVNREDVPARNGTTTATETAVRGDSVSAFPEAHLESKTEDTDAATTTAASTTRAAAVNSTDAHVAAGGATTAALMEKQKMQAAAVGVRVARRPALCCGSGDGRVRIFSPLAPKELAINDPAAQDLLLAKGRARPAKERAEPYMWTPGVKHAHAVKAGISASSGVEAQAKRRGGGPSEPHGWALVQTVRAHRTAVTCGALSLDHQWLATGSAGGLTRSDRMAGATPLLRVWQLSPRDIAYEEAWLHRQKSVDAARAATERNSGTRRAVSDQPRVRVDPTSGAVDVWWPSSSDDASTSQSAADASAEATTKTRTEVNGKSAGESSNNEGNDALSSDRTTYSSSSCDAVACMGLDGKACVAEGSGHAKALTCILWLPCPVDDYRDYGIGNNNVDSDGMAPSAPQQHSQQKGKLYHIVTGSRDGELRQWCIRLGGPPRRPASRISTPLAANSRELFPFALTDAICVRVLRPPYVDTTTTASSSNNNNTSAYNSNNGNNNNNSGEHHDGPSSSSTEPRGFDQSQAAILSLELLDESASSECPSIDINGSSDGKNTSRDLHDMQNEMNHGGKVAARSSPPTVRVVVGDGLGRVRVWTLRLPRDRQTMEVSSTPESNQDIVDESTFDGSHYSANNKYNNEEAQSEPGESQFTSEFEDVAAEEARWREDACWGVGRDPTSAEIEEAAVDEEAAAPASNGSVITATAARACALADEKLARDLEARRGAGTPWEVANYAPCSIKAAVSLLNPIDRQLRKHRQPLPSDPNPQARVSVNSSEEAGKPLLPSLLMGLSVPFQSSLLNLSTLQGAPLLSPLVRAGLSEADAMLAAVRKVEREQEVKALEQAPGEAKIGDNHSEVDHKTQERQSEAARQGEADGKAQEENEGEDACVRRSSIDSSESNTLASSISLSGSTTAEDDAKGVALSGAGPATTTTSVVEGADWSPMGFWVTKPAPVWKEPKPPAPEVVDAARVALATKATTVAEIATPVAAGADGTGSGEVFSNEQIGSEFGLQQQQRRVSQQKEVAYYSTAWLGAHDGGLVCVEGEATLSHALRQREVHGNSIRSYDGSNKVLPKGQQGQGLEGMSGTMPSKPPRLITGGADWAIHVWVPERPRLVSEPNPAGEKP